VDNGGSGDEIDGDDFAAIVWTNLACGGWRRDSLAG
jgi:hypothetical protein